MPSLGTRGIGGWLALAGLAACLGVTVAVALGREEGRRHAPADWLREARGQPFVNIDVLGDGPPPWSGWSLAAYQALGTSASAQRMSLEVDLSASTQLFIALARTQPRTGAGLLLRAGEVPLGQRIAAAGTAQPLSCTDGLAPVPSGRVTITMARTQSGWTATVNGARLDCSGDLGTMGPALVSGLRRVDILHLTIDDTPVPGPQRSGLIWGFLAFLGVLGAGAAERRLGVGTIPSLASFAPLGLGLLLLPVDSAWLAEALRIPEDPDGRLVVYFTIGLTLAAKLVGAAAILTRASLPDRWSRHGGWVLALAMALSVATQPGGEITAVVLGVAAPAAAFAALRWLIRSGDPAPVEGVLAILLWGAAATWASAAIGVTQPIGRLYAALAGLSIGTLIWVQVHAARIRAYNLVALLLALAAIGSTEVTVRFSTVGRLWSAVDAQQGAGSMDTLIRQFEDLDAAEHRIYPSDGFAVKLPPRTAPVRVACLGASSTGGAFQNDDLDDFFPARMNEILGPDVEVVNQGVGGWTSFHIQLFVERHLDTIDPDVITIYLGVNERLPTPVSFAELHGRWQAGDLQAGWSALDTIRLYQGLRLLARALRPGAGAGVSPDELGENLSAVIADARKRGIPTLLMSEGVQPDPGLLWAYWEAMRPLADGADDVAWLDTAKVLQSVGPRAFIDSNHLTATGHEAVARAAASELKRLGWLKPR